MIQLFYKNILASFYRYTLKDQLIFDDQDTRNVKVKKPLFKLSKMFKFIVKDKFLCKKCQNLKLILPHSQAEEAAAENSTSKKDNWTDEDQEGHNIQQVGPHLLVRGRHLLSQVQWNNFKDLIIDKILNHDF